jgi:hypothetical protein
MTEFDHRTLKLRVDQLLREFMDTFRDRYGYDAGKNVLEESRPGEDASVLISELGEEDLRGDLLQFFRHFARLALPDVGNGYFVGPPTWMVSIWKASEPRGIEDVDGVRELVAIGSDGGGGIFATLRAKDSPIYLLPPARICDGMYIPFGGARLGTLEVADSFEGFLGELVSRLEDAVTA